VSVRLLLDQGLPREAAERLRAAGVDCSHAGEIGMALAADIEILEFARTREFTVVTLDADFHAMLAVQGASSPSVIRIRIQGLNGVTLSTLIGDAIAQYAAELRSGCMITVKTRKTTCHLLSRRR
jgi:predicted nuclease of predicted toxin-antitoxin system